MATAAARESPMPTSRMTEIASIASPTRTETLNNRLQPRLSQGTAGSPIEPDSQTPTAASASTGPTNSGS